MFHEQMLLSQCYTHPPLSSKSITDQSHIHSHLTPPFSFPIFATPKTPKKPSKQQQHPTRFSRPDSQPLPQSAITRIAEKLRNLGFSEDAENLGPEAESQSESAPASAGEIFIPLRSQLPKYRVGHTIDNSWSTPENPVPQPGSGGFVTRYNEMRSEVMKEKELDRKKKKEVEKVPTLAELKLPKEELRRLSSIGIKLKKKLKIGKAGITEGIVNGIHERWRNAELVKITCEDLCKMNMKRTHDLLERKTGGLVVWRSGSNIILYRGADYRYPYFSVENVSPTHNAQSDLSGESGKESYPTTINDPKSTQSGPVNKAHNLTLIQGVGSPNRVRFQLPGEAQLTEEADSLLDGLGPRFSDWWGYEPVPVDADLLPAIIPGYRRPFRLLPYGVNPKLTNDEMTTLRRLGRPLPCHFALGRNRNLQGLAAAIVKLWEKCEIAKIAVKRGVQNTNSEMMAEELRRLTGGLLLSRDREFIGLYRGKDFLPSAVSSAIEERRKYRAQGRRQTEFRHDSSLSESVNVSDEIDKLTRDNSSEQNNIVAVEKAVTGTSAKLSMALAKKAQAERILAELQDNENLEQPDVDKEGITTEERYMLRKVGLRMKPFLLMGRRGVFDGTIENMHLHWKYRELVKIICKEESVEDVRHVAHILEAESGGILVAVERVNKGYAVIVYRGKNYKRPASIRPKTLLNKRAALKRSLEAQRSESLKLHVLRLSRNIDQLKLQLDSDKEKIAMQSMEDVGSPQAGSNHEDFSSSLRSDEGGTSLSMSEDRQMVENIDFAVKSEVGGSFDVKTESLPSLFHEEFHQISLDGNVGGVSDFAVNETCELKDRNSMVVNGKNPVPGYEEIELVESSNESAEDNLHQLNAAMARPQRSLSLTKKERLLLRKQALQMKKRPLLAVGRSNVVTGVAKAIKAHFEKHPVAIVNVKGRAKGTSVQELAFKLEQETGAMLVSLEPNKVILYRGWGAVDVLGNSKKTAGVMTKTPDNLGQSCHAVSPELIEAMKLECGLQSYQEEQATV